MPGPGMPSAAGCSGFGCSALLDAFTYSNGNLTTVASDFTVMVGDTTPTVSSNQVASPDTSGHGVTYNVTTFGADQEAWMDYATAAGNLAFICRATNPGTTSRNGYWVEYDTSGHNSYIFKITGSNSFAQLATTTAYTAASGDGMGIECIGTAIKFKKRVSGTWSDILSVTDSSVSGTGYVGFSVQASTSIRADNFHGGNR